jgi:hypothetical protein
MENFEEEQPFDNPVNEIIDSEDEQIGAVVASIYKKVEKPINISAEALALVASANAVAVSSRKVGRFEAMEVLSRSLERTIMNFQNPEQRAFTALREVSDYINMATTGAQPKIAKAHTDLLPVGHPMSTKFHMFSMEEVAKQRGEWMSADPRIAEEFRPLVASAFETPVGSLQREYLLAKLEAAPATDVPREVVLSLTASGDPYGGGNSFLARSARARAQRRDRKGRFAWMGGGARAFLGKAGRGISTLFRFAGYDQKSDSFDLEVRNHPTLGSGLVRVPASKVEAIKAILKDDLIDLPDPEVEIIDSSLLVDPDTIQRIDAPSGWRKVADGIYESDDGWYAIRDENTANRISSGGLEGIDRIRGGKTDGSIDNDQPLFFIGRKNQTYEKPIAVTQSWADAQSLIGKYDKKEGLSPASPSRQNTPENWSETGGINTDPNSPKTFKDRGGNYEVVQHSMSSPDATDLIKQAKEDGTGFKSYDGAKAPDANEPLLELYRVDRAGRKTKIGLFQDWDDVDDSIDSIDLESKEFRPNTPAGEQKPSTAFDFYGDIVVDTQENYGNTVDFVSGLKPSDGYIVSTGREFLGADGQIRERRVAPEDFERNGKNILKDFAINNRDLLTQPGFYLGTWIDEVENPDGTKSEMIFLDVSQRIQNPDEAFEKANARGEIAYWGVKEGYSFYTADEKRNRDLTEQIIAENKPIRELKEAYLKIWDEMPTPTPGRDEIVRERWSALNDATSENLRSIFDLTNGRDVGDRTNGLSESLMDSRDLYVGDDKGTVEMNYALRNGLPVPSSLVKKIDTLVKSSKLKRDYIFHRGAILTREQVDALNGGDVFTDHGFQSSSTDLGVALSYIDSRFENKSYIGEDGDAVKSMFHITAPKGFNAVSVAGGGEVILARDAEMKITKKWEDNGIVHFDLTIIGENKNVRPRKANPQENGGSSSELQPDNRGTVRRVGGDDSSGFTEEPEEQGKSRRPIAFAGKRDKKSDAARRARREAIFKNASKQQVEPVEPLSEDEFQGEVQRVVAVADDVAEKLPTSPTDLLDPNNPLNVVDAEDITKHVLGKNFDNTGTPLESAMEDRAAVFLEPTDAWKEIDSQMDEIGGPLAQQVLGLLQQRYGREYRAAQDAKDELTFAHENNAKSLEQFAKEVAPLKREIIQALKGDQNFANMTNGSIAHIINMLERVERNDPSVSGHLAEAYGAFQVLATMSTPKDYNESFFDIKAADIASEFKGIYQTYKGDRPNMARAMLDAFYNHASGGNDPEDFIENLSMPRGGFAGTSEFPPLMSVLPNSDRYKRPDGTYGKPPELQPKYITYMDSRAKLIDAHRKYTSLASSIAEKLSRISREVLEDAGVEFGHGETIPSKWGGVIGDFGMNPDRTLNITPGDPQSVVPEARTERGASKILADGLGALPKSLVQLLKKYFSDNKPINLVADPREFIYTMRKSESTGVANIKDESELEHVIAVGGSIGGSEITAGALHESVHIAGATVLRGPMTALEWVRRARLFHGRDADGNPKIDFVSTNPLSSGLAHNLSDISTLADSNTNRGAQELGMYSPELQFPYSGKYNGREDGSGTTTKGGVGNNPFASGELTTTILQSILGGSSVGVMSDGSAIYRIRSGTNADGSPRYLQVNPQLISPSLLGWGLAQVLLMDRISKGRLANN